jgi:hypothetical protein
MRVRVHSHAAAALVNFCEGVEHDTLVPYIDTIFERLLKLLSPGTGKEPTRRYVQEQAITSLAMVADASETTFAKVRMSARPWILRFEPHSSTTRLSCLSCWTPWRTRTGLTIANSARRRWNVLD